MMQTMMRERAIIVGARGWLCKVSGQLQLLVDEGLTQMMMMMMMVIDHPHRQPLLRGMREEGSNRDDSAAHWPRPTHWLQHMVEWMPGIDSSVLPNTMGKCSNSGLLVA